MGYLLSATRHSSTVANSSCEALEQPHIGHQKKKKRKKRKEKKTVTESVGLATRNSKAKKEARVVESLLYFRGGQQKKGVGFVYTLRSFYRPREGST